MSLRSASRRLLVRAFLLHNPHKQHNHLTSLAFLSADALTQPWLAQLGVSRTAPCAGMQSRRPSLLSPQCREFRTTSFQLASLEVKIESMGESITEGEIAEILKAVGDAVEEDETIAQIETDKVTIDVKAPSAGKLAELRVEQGETVKVGQVVAIIAEGEAGDSKPAEEERPAEAKTEPAKEEPAEEPKSKKEQEAQASPEAEAEDCQGRKPMIRFPPRMTESGQRISDLPLEERNQLLKQPSEAEPVSTAAEAAPKKEEVEAPPRRGPWYAGKEQGTKLSSSQVLSDREMEMIELGGAPP